MLTEMPEAFEARTSERDEESTELREACAAFETLTEDDLAKSALDREDFCATLKLDLLATELLFDSRSDLRDAERADFEDSKYDIRDSLLAQLAAAAAAAPIGVSLTILALLVEIWLVTLVELTWD